MNSNLKNLELVTVATDFNDAVKRYVQSCEKYDYKVTILGLEKEWEGGDMKNGIGGGQKVNLLKDYLKTLDENKLIIFTDSYDVIANNNLEYFYEKYNKHYKNKIVFGTECFCWPDPLLQHLFPDIENGINKYLNSGNFVGYKDDLLNIMSDSIEDNEDDQLYYSNIFLEEVKTKNFLNDKILDICLDYPNYLFVCLNGASNFSIDSYKSCIVMDNLSQPAFIHANGPPSIKRLLNNISNLCIREFNQIEQQLIDMYREKSEWCIDLPVIKIIYEGKNKNLSIFGNIFYPKEKLDIENISLQEAAEKADKISKYIYDYILYINDEVIIKNKYFLLDLVLENKSIIAPLFREENSIKSNFWGDLSNEGYYARSDSYLPLVNRNINGCFNVPYISSCFLIKSSLFNKSLFLDNTDKGEGIDMAMSYNCREKNIFMWILNKDFYGYLK